VISIVSIFVTKFYEDSVASLVVWLLEIIVFTGRGQEPQPPPPLSNCSDWDIAKISGKLPFQILEMVKIS